MDKKGRYEIEAEIGRGSMGVVFRAFDPVVRRAVAIKSFTLPAGLSEVQQHELKERSIREAQAAGGLSHPGIVTIYDVDEDPERDMPFIAMEYVPGESLEAVLAEQDLLNPELACSIVSTLADALAVAHDAGIVHRDIKPANILLREGDGAVKIADFGVARLEMSDLTRDGTSVGSPGYMSPEQIRGDRVDGRSDLFSLAVIFFRMLSGKKAFAGSDIPSLTYAIVHEDPPNICSLVPELPAMFADFFDRALAKDPDQRFHTAAGFHSAVSVLHTALTSTGSETLGSLNFDLDGSATIENIQMEQQPFNSWLLSAVSRPVTLSSGLVTGIALLLIAAGVTWSWLIISESKPLASSGQVKTESKATSKEQAPAPLMAPPAVMPDLQPTLFSQAFYERSFDRLSDELIVTIPADPQPEAVTALAKNDAAPVGPHVSQDSLAATPQNNRPATASATKPSEVVSSRGGSPSAKRTPEPVAVKQPVEIQVKHVPQHIPTPTPVSQQATTQRSNSTGSTHPSPAVPPTYLRVRIESGVKQGMLSLLVDGSEVYSRPLEAKSKDMVRIFKKMIGKAQESYETRVELTPGEHTIIARLVFEGKTKVYEKSMHVDLGAGEYREIRLSARNSLGRALSWQWD